MLKIVLATAAIVAVLAAVKDGRVLENAGLVGSCSAVAAPAGDDGSWAACVGGRLEGPPDLSRKSCVWKRRVGDVEYWRCESPIGAGRSPS